MIITVASGKGGTGKTTVAVSLAAAIQADLFLDCDVEAPDADIYLKPEIQERKDVCLLIPEVDKARCAGCGICGEVCQFHAIALMGEIPLVFPALCHGCGSCALNCPEGAINEVPRILGLVESGPTPEGIQFARGLLNVGEPLAVPVIDQLISWKSAGDGQVEIRDAPPGTSCPVVASLQGADYALLVTEPTRFGLHDLKLAGQLVRELSLPAGVIINRDSPRGVTGVERYCRDQGLPVLLRIPLERSIAEGTARGRNLIEIHPQYQQLLGGVYDKILGQQRNSFPAAGPGNAGRREKT
ncbi:MAG: ATP-binding protein [Anaerolineales bacterium]|nr:ATP-binding protein [Anaerolineales bacterium]